MLWRRRPQSVDLNSTAISYFIFFAKPLVAIPIRALLQSHVVGIFVLTSLLSFAWPYRFNTVAMSDWWALPTLFVAADFLHYWDHRLKHTIRWFWANHAVHHSANVFNLSEAYRLGWTGSLSTNLVLFTPLVLVGFHPKDVFWMLAWQQTYQFFVHCDWVPKLGWLEKVLVTPSHHRVHHAINENYLNRNFGGVLIIFDQMFGTYTEEIKPCKYGLLEPVVTKNPFVILFVGWRALFRDSFAAYRKRGLKAALWCAFGPMPQTANPSLDATLEVQLTAEPRAS